MTTKDLQDQHAQEGGAATDRLSATPDTAAHSKAGRMIGTVYVDGHRFPAMLPDARALRADELQPGMAVLLPGRRVRTVTTVTPTRHQNMRNETILLVSYAEQTQDWGPGNTTGPGSIWKVAL